MGKPITLAHYYTHEGRRICLYRVARKYIYYIDFDVPVRVKKVRAEHEERWFKPAAGSQTYRATKRLLAFGEANGITLAAIKMLKAN